MSDRTRDGTPVEPRVVTAAVTSGRKVPTKSMRALTAAATAGSNAVGAKTSCGAGAREIADFIGTARCARDCTGIWYAEATQAVATKAIMRIADEARMLRAAPPDTGGAPSQCGRFASIFRN